MKLQPLGRISSAALLSLSFAACTAWQYEIEPCDPGIADLSKDLCNQLNPNMSDCMLYQCDSQTLTCKLTPRDFDRDGDPDRSCGGKDCNDFNRYVNGLSGDACSCSPDKLGTSCSVGEQGTACERSSSYTCSNNQLLCPTTPAAAGSWQDHADLTTGSWDWDCDGSVEKACSYVGAQMPAACAQNPAAECDATVTTAIKNLNATALCDYYCNQFSNKLRTPCDDHGNTAPPKIFNCTNDCGASVGYCWCTWMYDATKLPLFGYCASISPSQIAKMVCK